MKAALLIALSFFALACESKPTRPAVSEKPTPEALAEAPLDFMILVENGPGSTETLFLAHKPVGDCLRDGVRSDPSPLQLMFLGKLNGAGRLLSPRIDGGGAGMRACLQEALKSLKLEPGSKGLVKIHVTRGATAPAGSKPFSLEGQGPKKFE